MYSIHSLAKRYFILSVVASLVTIAYVLPSFPNSVSGWLWVFGLSLPFSFFVGVASDIIIHYRPSTRWRRYSGVIAALIFLVVLSAAFFYMVGATS